MNNLMKLNDIELEKEVHRLARAMSYFNAAEGNWSQEAAERDACRVDFRNAISELNRRGLTFENRGYLI